VVGGQERTNRLWKFFLKGHALKPFSQTHLGKAVKKIGKGDLQKQHRMWRLTPRRAGIILSTWLGARREGLSGTSRDSRCGWEYTDWQKREKRSLHETPQATRK